MKNVTVVGNNLAALVLSDRLAEKGRSVSWMAPEGGTGGFFGGIRIRDRWFDFGTVLLEFFSFNRSADDLSTFNPDIFNDFARFFGRVDDYVRDLNLPARELPPGRVRWRGREWGDFVFGNDLETLQDLDPETRGAMIAELERIVAGEGHPLHARHKKTGDRFVRADLQTASVANHGELFHGHFFEPAARQVLGRSSSDYIALYHRLVRVPLYYPETLLEILRGEPMKMPRVSFHGVAGEGVFAVCHRILDRVRKRACFRQETRKVKRLVLHDDHCELLMEDGSVEKSSDLVYGGSPEVLWSWITGEKAPALDRSPVCVAFLLLPRDRVKMTYSSLIQLDLDCPVFRVTNQDALSMPQPEKIRMTVEFSQERCRETGFDARNVEDVLGVLQKLDLIPAGTRGGEVEMETIEQGVLLPTPHNHAVLQPLIQKLRAMSPRLHLIGGSLSFLATSLNEQVVHALALDQALTHREVSS